MVPNPGRGTDSTPVLSCPGPYGFTVAGPSVGGLHPLRDPDAPEPGEGGDGEEC